MLKADRKTLNFGRLKRGCVYSIDVMLEASPEAVANRSLDVEVKKEGHQSIVLLLKKTQAPHQNRIVVHVLADEPGQIAGCLRFAGAGALKPISVLGEVVSEGTFERNKAAFGKNPAAVRLVSTITACPKELKKPTAGGVDKIHMIFQPPADVRYPSGYPVPIVEQRKSVHDNPDRWPALQKGNRPKTAPSRAAVQASPASMNRPKTSRGAPKPSNKPGNNQIRPSPRPAVSQPSAPQVMVLDPAGSTPVPSPYRKEPENRSNDTRSKNTRKNTRSNIEGENKEEHEKLRELRAYDRLQVQAASDHDGLQSLLSELRHTVQQQLQLADEERDAGKKTAGRMTVEQHLNVQQAKRLMRRQLQDRLQHLQDGLALLLQSTVNTAEQRAAEEATRRVVAERERDEARRIATEAQAHVKQLSAQLRTKAKALNDAKYQLLLTEADLVSSQQSLAGHAGGGVNVHKLFPMPTDADTTAGDVMNGNRDAGGGGGGGGSGGGGGGGGAGVGRPIFAKLTVSMQADKWLQRVRQRYEAALVGSEEHEIEIIGAKAEAHAMRSALAETVEELRSERCAHQVSGLLTDSQ
jgi:hypothetical protein